MIPENELGVIVEFSKNLTDRFEIVSIQDMFPDLILMVDGIKYRAEFEYTSSNFMAHRHDPRGCDIIICWKHDRKDIVLPVLELSDPAWTEKEIVLPTCEEREISYWKSRALLAESRLMRKQHDKKVYIPRNNDWRRLPEEDKSLVFEMNTSEIAEKYGVSERTARNWRVNARNGNEIR